MAGRAAASGSRMVARSPQPRTLTVTAKTPVSMWSPSCVACRETAASGPGECCDAPREVAAGGGSIPALRPRPRVRKTQFRSRNLLTRRKVENPFFGKLIFEHDNAPLADGGATPKRRDTCEGPHKRPISL